MTVGRLTCVCAVVALSAACGGGGQTAPPLPPCVGAPTNPALVPGGPNGGGATVSTPRITNRSEVGQARQREYPELIRIKGPTGWSSRTFVWVLIGPEGDVVDAVLQVTSGTREIDQAALRVAEAHQFEPISSGDCAVSAWTLLPVEFEIRVRVR